MYMYKGPNNILQGRRNLQDPPFQEEEITIKKRKEEEEKDKMIHDYVNI